MRTDRSSAPSRFRLWLILWLLALVCVIGCESRSKPPVRLATLPWPGYEPIVLGRDLGYYEKRSVDILDFSTPTQVLRAFRNGAIDVGLLTMDQVLFLRQDIADLKIVLLLDFSNGADAVMAKPDIGSLQDLRGRRIGYEANALGAYMLTRTLEQAGLRLHEVKAVSVELDEHEKAFRAGEVDAIVTSDPSRSRLLATGAKLLFDSSKIPNEITDVLVVRESYLKSNPEAVEALLRGWFKALKYMEANSEDAYKRIGWRLKSTPVELRDTFSLMKLLDLAENRRLLTGNPPGLLPSVHRLVDIMLAHKMIARPDAIETLFDGSLIEAIQRE